MIPRHPSGTGASGASTAGPASPGFAAKPRRSSTTDRPPVRSTLSSGARAVFAAQPRLCFGQCRAAQLAAHLAAEGLPCPFVFAVAGRVKPPSVIDKTLVWRFHETQEQTRAEADSPLLERQNATPRRHCHCQHRAVGSGARESYFSATRRLALCVARRRLSAMAALSTRMHGRGTTGLHRRTAAAPSEAKAQQLL